MDMDIDGDAIIFIVILVIVFAFVFIGITFISDDTPTEITYFVETTECTVNDENITYSFKKKYLFWVSTIENNTITIMDEGGYPIRIFNDAKCDINVKKVVEKTVVE